MDQDKSDLARGRKFLVITPKEAVEELGARSEIA
jgi:hypothetical protein